MEPHQMCFGLNLELDRESIACFLQLMANPELTETLTSRLSSDDIQKIVHSFTGILKKNLTEDEYHQLFLQEVSPHTQKTID